MKSLFTFFLIITVFCVSAQEGVIVKYFDSLWKPAAKENASYYTHFVKEDTLYKCTSFYAKSSQLYGKSTFTDTLFSKGKGRGKMLLYYQSGGLKDSTVFGNSGKILADYKFYENHKLKATSDTVEDLGKIIRHYYPTGGIKDSIFKAKCLQDYYAAAFSETGNRDTLICFDKDSNNLVINCFDKLGNLISRNAMQAFTTIQIEASFPGGSSEWKKYLVNNLQSDLPKRNGAPKGRYAVVVSFLVEKDGSISEVKTENNPGFGTSEEAIRVVSKVPKWTPAIQNGHTVKYRARQPITFVVN